MKNDMQFTGADTFLDKNVFSIILEVPNSALGSNPKVGIWYRVLIPKDGNLYQIDRMGHPFVNVAFTKEEDKDMFKIENFLPKSLPMSSNRLDIALRVPIRQLSHFFQTF